MAVDLVFGYSSRPLATFKQQQNTRHSLDTRTAPGAAVTVAIVDELPETVEERYQSITEPPVLEETCRRDIR